jgi:hypothetical protein
LALPLFVRLLAAFFLRKRKEGRDLESAHRWWSAVKSDIGDIRTIVKLVTPPVETDLLDLSLGFDDFRKVGLSYFPFRTIKNFKDDRASFSNF